MSEIDRSAPPVSAIPSILGALTTILGAMLLTAAPDATAVPEVFGVPTSTLLLIVGAFAAAFAGGTFLVNRANYYRAGARIKVNVATAESRTSFFDPHLVILAENNGLASADVKYAYFKFKRMKDVTIREDVFSRKYFFDRRGEVGSPEDVGLDKTSRTIAGYSQAPTWGLSRIDLLYHPTNPNREVKVRAVVTLAGIGRRKSRWMKIRVLPFIEGVNENDENDKIQIPVTRRPVPGTSAAGAPPPLTPEPDFDPTAIAKMKALRDAGAESGTVEFVGEDGNPTQAKFVMSPPGWKPGDPIPPEILAQFQFDAEPDGDASGEGEASS